MIKFNYILNDIAFDTLIIKCLYAEPTDEDIKECENQIKLLKQENNELKKQLEELINWLESKNNITLTQHKTIEPVIKVQEVIDKIKEGE